MDWYDLLLLISAAVVVVVSFGQAEWEVVVTVASMSFTAGMVVARVLRKST
jgi:adenine/guanine phosphoribosyltransferase-like PRPP-binding protein